MVKVEDQPSPVESSSVTPAEVEPVAPEVAPKADQTEALAVATRLYEQGKLLQAKVALEELISQDSSNSNAWMMLGQARFDSHDISGAEEAATTALALNPQMARAHLLRATILIDAKQRAQAAGEIQKYLELEPNGPYAAEAKALLKR